MCVIKYKTHPINGTICSATPRLTMTHNFAIIAPISDGSFAISIYSTNQQLNYHNNSVYHYCSKSHWDYTFFLHLEGLIVLSLIYG
jgi:hypothetical protein